MKIELGKTYKVGHGENGYDKGDIFTVDEFVCGGVWITFDNGNTYWEHNAEKEMAGLELTEVKE